MDIILSKYLRPPPAQFDFDKELCADLLRREWDFMQGEMGHVFTDAQGNRYPDGYISMSLNEMDVCIAESVSRGGPWQWGPRGVLRRRLPYIPVINSPIGGTFLDDEDGPGDADDYDTEGMEDEDEEEEFSDVEDDDDAQASGQQGQNDEDDDAQAPGQQGQNDEGTDAGNNGASGSSVTTAIAKVARTAVNAPGDLAAAMRRIKGAWLDKLEAQKKNATTQTDTTTNPTTDVADDTTDDANDTTTGADDTTDDTTTGDNTTTTLANTTTTGTNPTTTAQTNVVKDVDTDMTGTTTFSVPYLPTSSSKT